MDGSQFQMSLMLQRLQSAEVAINLETVGSRWREVRKRSCL